MSRYQAPCNCCSLCIIEAPSPRTSKKQEKVSKGNRQQETRKNLQQPESRHRRHSRLAGAQGLSVYNLLKYHQAAEAAVAVAAVAVPKRAQVVITEVALTKLLKAWSRSAHGDVLVLPNLKKIIAGDLSLSTSPGVGTALCHARPAPCARSSESLCPPPPSLCPLQLSEAGSFEGAGLEPRMGGEKGAPESAAPPDSSVQRFPSAFSSACERGAPEKLRVPGPGVLSGRAVFQHGHKRYTWTYMYACMIPYVCMYVNPQRTTGRCHATATKPQNLGFWCMIEASR